MATPLYMYVILWTHQHVGITADIITSWALSIIIIATHVNMHRIAFFPDVSRHDISKGQKVLLQ